MNETEPHANHEPFGVDASGQGTPTPLNSNEKLFGGLAYAGQIFLPLLVPIVLLLSEEGKRSRFVRYHAIQSLGLIAASILYEILATIVFVMVSVLLPCLGCVSWIVFLLPLAALLYYGWQAFHGQYVEVPLLTKFLKDNALL